MHQVQAQDEEGNGGRLDAASGVDLAEVFLGFRDLRGVDELVRHVRNAGTLR